MEKQEIKKEDIIKLYALVNKVADNDMQIHAAMCETTELMTDVLKQLTDVLDKLERLIGEIQEAGE